MNGTRNLQFWVWGVPLTILFLRCIFQGFLFPWELSGDEAQYWDWSRHPSLSYYTKGPGVTWLMTLTTSIFGETIFGIRVGNFLCHAIAGVAVGSIAMQLSGHNKKTVLTTVIGYQCLLGYQIGGSLMTVDMMMVAGWSVATWATIQACQNARQGASVKSPLWIMGAALGISFLAKYTALLAASGLATALWFQRDVLFKAPGFKRGLQGSLIFLSLGMLPILLWNAQRGWPTVEHLLGHLHVPGGDSGTTSWFEYDPLWTLQYLGQVLGLAGPILGWVLLRGALWAGTDKTCEDKTASILLWSALPLLVFYLLVSLKGPTEGNWSVGAYAPLLPLGAYWIQKKSAKIMKMAFCLLIGLRGALTGALLLSLMGVAPTINPWLESQGLKPLPVHRVSGHQAFADQLDLLMKKENLSNAPVICDYYDKTALLSYYLPGRPTVFCGSVVLGSRPSAYDDFPETRFPAPQFAGIEVILVGADQSAWELALKPENLISLGSLQQRNRQRWIFRAQLRSTEEDRP